jgi:ABC-type ATPase involved in cell division
MELFSKINKEGKTILVATHHKGIVDKMKKRTIEIKQGKMVNDTKVKTKKKEKVEEEKKIKDKEDK